MLGTPQVVPSIVVSLPGGLEPVPAWQLRPTCVAQRLDLSFGALLGLVRFTSLEPGNSAEQFDELCAAVVASGRRTLRPLRLGPRSRCRRTVAGILRDRVRRARVRLCALAFGVPARHRLAARIGSRGGRRSRLGHQPQPRRGRCPGGGEPNSSPRRQRARVPRGNAPRSKSRIAVDAPPAAERADAGHEAASAL